MSPMITATSATLMIAHGVTRKSRTAPKRNRSNAVATASLLPHAAGVETALVDYACFEEIRSPALSNFRDVTVSAPSPEALARALLPVCGTGNVLDLHRLSGGASRETWTFDLVTP